MNQTQATSPETQTTARVTQEGAAAPETEKAPEQISPRFAALARAQKEFRAAQMKLKQEQEAFEAQKKKYETDYIPKERLKADPFKALVEEGISYDEIVKAAMSQDPTSQALKSIEQRFETLEQKLERQNQEAQEKQTKQYEQAVNQIRNDVKVMVDANEEYEAIKASGDEGIEAVVELITEHFKETEQVLTIEDASKHVEDYLLEQAMKYAQLGKVKKKLTPQEDPATEKPLAPQAKQTTAPQVPQKTLTHSNTVNQAKPLSAADRRARAIAAFNEAKLNRV